MMVFPGLALLRDNAAPTYRCLIAAARCLPPHMRELRRECSRWYECLQSQRMLKLRHLPRALSPFASDSFDFASLRRFQLFPGNIYADFRLSPTTAQ